MRRQQILHRWEWWEMDESDFQPEISTAQKVQRAFATLHPCDGNQQPTRGNKQEGTHIFSGGKHAVALLRARAGDMVPIKPPRAFMPNKLGAQKS